MPDYQFTTDWFSHNIPVWNQLIEHVQPSSFLEIGSYEGRAACYMIERVGSLRPLEIDCVDTWQGGLEHDQATMAAVEQRFHGNLAQAMTRVQNPVAFRKHKGASSDVLARLIAAGRAASVDLVYVDGSHQAPDVLLDAVLGFELLKVGGVMIFDDYVWQLEPDGAQDHYNLPKPAIDAFVNIYRRKLALFSAPLYQFYVRKLA